MKRKRLFMFRTFRTKEVGLVRAYTVEEAVDLIMDHYNFAEAFEIRDIPRNFTLHKPSFK